MNTYRGRTVAALCGLAIVGGAVIGHSLLPRDTAAQAQPTAPVSTAGPMRPLVGPWHQVTRDEAYHSYVLAFGENNSCRKDFDDNYRGTIFIKDLPKALQQDLAEQDKEFVKANDIVPAEADWGTGTVIQVMAAPEQVLYLEFDEDPC